MQRWTMRPEQKKHVKPAFAKAKNRWMDLKHMYSCPIRFHETPTHTPMRSLANKAAKKRLPTELLLTVRFKSKARLSTHVGKTLSVTLR
jgi:hypothetical protein